MTEPAVRLLRELEFSFKTFGDLTLATSNAD